MKQERRKQKCKALSIQCQHSRLLEPQRVGELLLLLRAKEPGEPISKSRSDGDVGQGDAVADEERSVGEVSLERSHSVKDLVESVLEDGLDEGDEVDEHAGADFEPGGELRRMIKRRGKKIKRVDPQVSGNLRRWVWVDSTKLSLLGTAVQLGKKKRKN